MRHLRQFHYVGKFPAPIPFCLYPGNFIVGLCETVLACYFFIAGYLIAIDLSEPSFYAFVFGPRTCYRIATIHHGAYIGACILCLTNMFGAAGYYILMYYAVRGEGRTQIRRLCFSLTLIYTMHISGLAIIYYFYEICDDRKIRKGLVIHMCLYGVVQLYVILCIFFNNLEPRVKPRRPAACRRLGTEEASFIIIPLE